ncbi:MAG: hypothetical protein HRU32_05635 [Rhodobacteraceae bacterium]|nr:hypothetical protein [Paracoccaceae bacterium]
MALLISAVLFLAFFGNVLLGAMTGSPILNDVSEMLLLFAASIAFVAAILKREAQAKSKDSH